MRHRPRLVASLVCVLAGTALAGETGVTRRDLARAYLEFEAAYRQHPPADERLVAVHQAFDQASLHFFSGAFDKLLRGLTEETARLEGSFPLDEFEWFSRSLTTRMEPLVWVMDDTTPRRVVLRQMFEQVWPTTNSRAHLEAWSAEEQRIWSEECTWPEGTQLPAGIPVPDTIRFPVGPVVFRWVSGGESREIGRVMVVPEPLGGVRQRLQARIDALDETEGSLDEARQICRARTELLTDHPSEARSAEFLFDPNSLHADLSEEVAALEEGRDPYRDHRGDWWRVLPARSGGHPFRLFVPEGDVPARGWPVVIAFHGAGGDENMFMDGYGAGRLGEMAQERRFLAVSPLTAGAAGQRRFLERLLDSLEDDHPVDRDRVYVIGHSMGTGPTSLLADRCADLIAAACCIAGASPNRAQRAPTLWLRGTQDPLVRGPAPTAEPGSLEVRMLEGRGHTLIVSDELEGILDWLLEHTIQEH